MEKQGIKLEEICGYLPYKLKVQWIRPDDNEKIISELNMSDYLFLMNRHNAKPILRPLSDIVKPCLEDGKIPLCELAKISFPKASKCTINEFNKVDLNTSYSFGFDMTVKSFECMRAFDGKKLDYYCFVPNQLQLFQKLYEWHFDIHGLIERNLAIDINTIKS